MAYCSGFDDNWRGNRRRITGIGVYFPRWFRNLAVNWLSNQIVKSSRQKQNPEDVNNSLFCPKSCNGVRKNECNSSEFSPAPLGTWNFRGGRSRSRAIRSSREKRFEERIKDSERHGARSGPHGDEQPRGGCLEQEDRRKYAHTEARNVPDFLYLPRDQFHADGLDPVQDVQVRREIHNCLHENISATFGITKLSSRLRSHRAERRYGVQGDKSAQELAHLPSAMIEEDESELEDDETVFDINKMRVYVA